MKMHIPKAKKAAAKSQAAASCHNQQTRPSDLVPAKMILDLPEKWQNFPVRDLVRLGFSLERSYSIYFGYMRAVMAHHGADWAGAAEAARLIGLTRAQVLAMAQTGEIPGCDLRFSCHFHEEDMLNWIALHPLNPLDAELSAHTDPDRPRKPKRSA
jgi:hypothetical protein